VLLEANADVLMKDKANGRTALVTAAIDSSTECIEVLITHNAAADHVNAQDNEGMTALHWAVKLDGTEATTYLVENGKANLEVSDKDGKTALHYAAANRNADLVNYLLEKRAKADAKDGRGNTPLHSAATKDFVDIAQCILSSSNNKTSLLSAKNAAGDTPIHTAAAFGSMGVVLLFTDEGGQSLLQITNNNGFTPFVSASQSQSGQSAAAHISSITGEKYTQPETTEPKPKPQPTNTTTTQTETTTATRSRRVAPDGERIKPPPQVVKRATKHTTKNQGLLQPKIIIAAVIAIAILLFVGIYL